MIGQTLGNYRIIEQIGLGGMATVFKAYDPDTDRYVAIKVLPQHFSHDPTFKERFQREAKAIARLEHLHILPIYSYGEENGVAYMAMRYLHAGTLTDRIRQGPMPLPEVSRLLSQISSALDHAHSHGVLHRDIKPSNVLLDEAGNAYLTDFGIAKMVESTIDLTRGNILGTPAYMSPEQCQGVKELTPATDIYSLGIVVYEMVTGRTPFQAETPIALIHMQLSQPLPLPQLLRPDLPEKAERVILKALAKEPESRHATCSQFAAAFARAIQAPATEAAQPATLTPAPTNTVIQPTDEPTILHKSASQPGRRRWMWAAGAVVLLLLVGLVGLIAVLNWPEKSPAQQPTPVAVNTGQPETGPTPQSKEPTQLPAALADQPEPAPQVEAVTQPPTGKPSAEAMEMAYQLWPYLVVEPCNWAAGLDRGLCLTTWATEVDPIPILADSELEFIDAPSFSPDGRQITFSAAPASSDDVYANADIFVANMDGSDLVQLPLPGSQVAPTWSPSGDWLAFVHNGQLAVMRPNGTDLKVWLNLQEGQCANRPNWSPNGEQLVVSVQEICDDRLPITRQVWLVADEGQTVTPLVTTVNNNRDCVDFATAFSPDGRQVAYIDPECQGILINADSSGESTTLDDFPWEWDSNRFPYWQEFKFTDRCEYLEIGGPGVCIYSNYRHLGRFLQDSPLDLDRVAGPFNWSPTGEQLVFSAAEPDAAFNSLYTINADGSGLNQLSLPDNAVEPVWSPDGEWLAFHYIGHPAIAHPDGSELTVLHEGPECASRLQWSPDSRWLVVSMKLDPATCDYEFPQTRGVWLISLESKDIFPLAEINYPRECDEDTSRVAFNRTGQYVAYIQADCQPVVVNRDTPADPIPITEFPWWWENNVSPQWGGLAGQLPFREDHCPAGQVDLFFDDFEGGLLDHWGTNPGEAGGITNRAWEIGEDGNNHFLVGKQHNWAVTGSNDWQNYRLQLRFRRVQAASDAHLNIYLGDGTRYMWHLMAGLLKRDNLDKGEKDKLLDDIEYQLDTKWHQFSLAAVDGYLEVQFDGQSVASYDDPNPLPGGPIGLENINGVIWYDNILVCGIP